MNKTDFVINALTLQKQMILLFRRRQLKNWIKNWKIYWLVAPVVRL